MLMKAIDSYLAVRRAGGYDLFEREGFLRSFAKERGETHVGTQSAIDWARLGSSPPQWDRRLKEVIRFARHVHAEDPQHQIPPQRVFGHFPTPQRIPFTYSDADCVHRPKANTHSGRSRTVIPEHAERPFRAKANTDSGASRTRNG